jgi:50S ribosomal protein L16 3-hydroxylase
VDNAGMNVDRHLLGGLSAARFLREYWHKQPLLVRGAVPDFDGLLDRDALFALAADEGVESRLVRLKGGSYELDHGPFPASRLARMGRRDWTVLVQGVNHCLPRAQALVERFRFIPEARLDDLMVSYAADGGSVGPHFDSYDVFLLQGMGRRRWEVSTQTDMALVPEAPLRILSDFRAEQSWVLEPGDMLYLPPRCAHHGVALGPCTTLSIGFRAPSAQDLATAWLDYLRDTVDLDGMYADPDLAAGDAPGRIPEAMARFLDATLERLPRDVATRIDFLGRYLSEPKPHVMFDPPHRPLGVVAFLRRVREQGAVLDARSRMLYRGRSFFLNGEAIPPMPGAARLLKLLADTRRIPPGENLPESLADWLCEAYRNGYLRPGQA